MLSMISRQVNANQHHHEIPLHTKQNGYDLKEEGRKITNFGKEVDKLESCALLVGTSPGASAVETMLTEIKHTVTI